MYLNSIVLFILNIWQVVYLYKIQKRERTGFPIRSDAVTII